jgi:hypothetical protein
MLWLQQECYQDNGRWCGYTHDVSMVTVQSGLHTRSWTSVTQMYGMVCFIELRFQISSAPGSRRHIWRHILGAPFSVVRSDDGRERRHWNFYQSPAYPCVIKRKFKLGPPLALSAPPLISLTQHALSPGPQEQTQFDVVRRISVRTHVAETFMRSCQLRSYSRISLHFIESVFTGTFHWSLS